MPKEDGKNQTCHPEDNFGSCTFALRLHFSHESMLKKIIQNFNLMKLFSPKETGPRFGCAQRSCASLCRPLERKVFPNPDCKTTCQAHLHSHKVVRIGQPDYPGHQRTAVGWWDWCGRLDGEQTTVQHLPGLTICYCYWKGGDANFLHLHQKVLFASTGIASPLWFRVVSGDRHHLKNLKKTLLQTFS